MITKEKLLFLALFTLVGFGLLQIPFTKLAGSSISFTLFDFFAPIAGAFLGPLLGIISILAVELVQMVIKHQPFTTIAVIRLFPLLFASLYFAMMTRKNASRAILVVPLLAIIVFVLNPIGAKVWYYSLFWLIPVASYFWRKNLYIRSLGATFTAHAVGGAAWITFLHLPATVWKSLIPVVIEERLVFAAGIAVSFLAVKLFLQFLIKRHWLPHLPSLAL